MTKKKFSRNVGKKFNEDGTARLFPGNTVICHVPKESESFKYLLEFRKKIMSQNWAKKFSFLPPSSFHMTIFEGVCDSVRNKSHWTSKLPLDAKLEEVDNLLIAEWNKIEIPDSFSVKATGLRVGNTITIGMKPINSEMNKKMRDFRDLLSERFGIRQPNHSIYGFHVSYAYLIEKLSFKDKLEIGKFIKNTAKEIQEGFGIMRTNPPELTFFADMTNFAPDREKAIRNCKE